MKIIYKKGDLFQGPEKIIAHGRNARGVMGSGFALQIKKRFPEVYDFYKFTYNRSGLYLGDVIPYKENGITVLNCITQQGYGPGIQVSYEAIEKCMKYINKKYSDDIAMPMIGAGLGGGDWIKIEKIIEKESMNFQPVVYIL